MAEHDGEQAVMKRVVVFVLLMGLNATASAVQDAPVRKLDGTAILGNKETAKSLLFIPWRNSKTELQPTLDSELWDEKVELINEESFKRQFDLYRYLNGSS